MPTNGHDGSLPIPGTVLFSNPPATTIPDSQDPDPLSDTHPLAKELFGGEQAPPASSDWNPLVLESIQAKARGGLSEDIRASLLAKYEAKEDLAALAPPKLNKELFSALTPSVLKRDEYQSLLQAQVGACLSAFGSGMSILLRPETLHELNENAQSALPYLSEGIHLLADHHFRLSLNRRAFTKPSLNIIGKHVAEAAPVDEFLYGKNFAETLKAAQACERTGREVTKSSAPVGRKTQQPFRQQTHQDRNQPSTSKSRPSGNRKAPAQPARRSGAPFKGRHQRSQSRSRSRYHR